MLFMFVCVSAWSGVTEVVVFAHASYLQDYYFGCTGFAHAESHMLSACIGHSTLSVMLTTCELSKVVMVSVMIDAHSWYKDECVHHKKQ